MQPTEQPSKLSFYARSSQVLIGVIAFFYVMYIGADIIVPLVFASLLAILINPLVEFMVRWRFNRIVAISLALAAVTLLVAALGYFLGTQMGMFAEMLPMLKTKLLQLVNDVFSWLSQTFNISPDKGNELITKMKTEGMSTGTSVVGATLLSVGGILGVILLLPVYAFMILLYKSHLRQFIALVFGREHKSVVAEVITEVKSLVQKYLVGLLVEAALVAGLNAIALFILGVPYALLIGVIGALLNIIPYIGGIIAIAIPMLIALATQSPITALWVLIAYSVVQFIDNNLIVPRVVASKVQINGLLSIIVVLIGGALWGVSGMFLAIPVSAIFKVIFDRVEPLTPLGFLLGDSEEDEKTSRRVKVQDAEKK